MISWDTETQAFTREVKAPPLACVSVSLGRRENFVVDSREAKDVIEGILRSGEPMVLHNAPFDLTIVCANYPELAPLVFDVLDQDLVHCTEIREKLIDIAHGRYRKYATAENEEGEIEKNKINYKLSTLMRNYFGIRVEGKDDIRLRFGEVIGIPVEDWPRAFRDYAANDAWFPEAVRGKQEGCAEYLDDQYRQVRAGFWMQLMAVNGLRTDRDRVCAWIDGVKKEWMEIAADMIAMGFLRPGRPADEKRKAKAPSRNTKMVDAYIVEMCARRGLEVMRNEPTVGEIRKAFAEDRRPVGNVKRCKKTLPRYQDPLLDKYTRLSSLSKKLSADASLIKQGFISPYWEVLKETGRTGTSPNVQNLDRNSGIRSVFVPDPGCLFINADYGQFELHTWAQVCLTVLGHSKLAEALNAGIDPHLQLAAVMLGLSYGETRSRYLAGDKKVKDARQLCKIANFGYPGGMGALSFVNYALGYDKVISEELALELKAFWREQWPESWDYFRWVGQLTDTQFTQVRQLFSERIRGGSGFCDTCNTFFQGLAADGAKAAGYEIARAQLLGRPQVDGWLWNFLTDDTPGLLTDTMAVIDPYSREVVDQYASVEDAMRWGWRSALFRTKLNNFVHDEFIGSAPACRAAEAAEELARVMVLEANRFVPDVPAKAEPALMGRWQKDAETMRDSRGRLICWQPEVAA